MGSTTDVPSLADQIKRFQPRVFSSVGESSSRVFDRTAKVGEAILLCRVSRAVPGGGANPL